MRHELFNANLMPQLNLLVQIIDHFKILFPEDAFFFDLADLLPLIVKLPCFLPYTCFGLALCALNKHMNMKIFYWPAMNLQFIVS